MLLGLPPAGETPFCRSSSHPPSCPTQTPRLRPPKVPQPRRSPHSIYIRPDNPGRASFWRNTANAHKAARCGDYAPSPNVPNEFCRWGCSLKRIWNKHSKNNNLQPIVPVLAQEQQRVSEGERKKAARD